MELSMPYDGRITSCEERLQIINSDDEVMFKHKNSEANNLYSFVWNGAQFYSLFSRLVLLFHNTQFLIPTNDHQVFVEGRKSRSYFCKEIICIDILFYICLTVCL